MEEVERILEAVMRAGFVEVEASARHVHLTREQAQALFGHGLTLERELSQPGQFLAKERVTVVGPRGEFANVAVLGPERREAQVEISLTDGHHLGIQPPVRPSGQVTGSPGTVLVGPRGRVELSQGVIAAQRHIHLTPERAQGLGLRDGQTVALEMGTPRPVVFDGVLIRVSDRFADYAHLDFDEANACGWRRGELGRIRV